MKPAHRTLFHADAELVLERLDDASFDLIYLDPPWHTLQSSTHGVSCDTAEYPRYLSRIFQHCRRVLTDRGSLYFHAPAVSDINFRLILDQVFMATASLVIIIKQRQMPGSLRLGVHDHESILRYSRSVRSVYNPITRPPQDLAYSASDERGPYRLVDLTILGVRPSNQYEFLGKRPPPNRSWRFSLALMQQQFDSGRIVIATNGMPRLKQYFDEVVSTGNQFEISSIWDDIAFTRGRTGYYPCEQPAALASRIIRQSTNEDGWILDPFCGSGQFAVQAELLRRNWVAVDNNPEAMSCSVSRLQENAGVSDDCITRVFSHDIQLTPPVWKANEALFVNICQLEEARHKLDLVAQLILNIKSSSDLGNQTEEDVLAAIAENTPRLKYIMADSARELLYHRLETETPAFSSLCASSKDFLATAVMIIDTLPLDLDFSIVSVSAWKTVETELAEKVFAKFRSWFQHRHTDVTAQLEGGLGSKETKALTQFLRDGKELALGQMKWVLDLTCTSGKTMQTSPCLQNLAMFAQESLLSPAFILSQDGLFSLLTQKDIDTFRNGAAHRTLFSRERAEASLSFVTNLLPKLVAGLKCQDGAPTEEQQGVSHVGH